MPYEQVGGDEVEAVPLAGETLGALSLGLGQCAGDHVQHIVGVAGHGQWGAHEATVGERCDDHVNWGPGRDGPGSHGHPG
ncbi:hypothetical protein GCM10027612_40590 [Microbispora bryophytorum subsp. camponoti]